ncbi:MAG: hypothetical protein H6Q89_4254 [Myxococcaceae bacterium]|nr:hypothetical protein [Myxococcaceae bacterium]
MTALPDKKLEKKPLLERVGVRYFEQRSAGKGRPPAAAQVDAVHLLNPEERAAVKRVERGAIFRSFLAGAISAAIAAVAEVWATPLAPEGTALLSSESLKFWAIVGGATAIAAVLEILYLYWDILRSVHELSQVTGLQLFGASQKDSDRAIAEALARAALELPNPITLHPRINPRREASKWRLLAASVIYKLKVGVSNFLIKMLVRRILGRVFVRSLVNSVIPFAAVPITAAWNGVVTWLVMREARLRAMGPSAAQELVSVVFADAPVLSEAGRLAAVRAVAAAIVRTQDLHPNLVALLAEVQHKAGDTGNAELDDPGEFLRSLRVLPAGEQRLALQTLVVACIVDGRVSRREKKLLTEAFAAVGRPVDFGPVHRLRREFVAGNGVADDAVRAL